MHIPDVLQAMQRPAHWPLARAGREPAADHAHRRLAGHAGCTAAPWCESRRSQRPYRAVFGSVDALERKP
jgi:hypothetical protein